MPKSSSTDESFKPDNKESQIHGLLAEMRTCFELGISAFQPATERVMLLMMARCLLLMSNIFESIKEKGQEVPEFFQKFAKSFKSDLKRFQSLNASAVDLNLEFDQLELSQLVERLQDYVFVVDREVRSLIPERTAWTETMDFLKRVVSRYWWGFLMAGAFAVAGMLYHIHRQQALLKGHGLIGEYFSDQHFKVPVQQRLDYNIDFNWKSGGPTPQMRNNRDNFSIIWRGYLYVPRSGEQSFAARADDGVKIFIDDRMIMNEANWQVTTTTMTYLSEGFHKIRIEYFEAAGLAGIHLYWNDMESGERKVIAPEFFYPEPPQNIPVSAELEKLENHLPNVKARP